MGFCLRKPFPFLFLSSLKEKLDWGGWRGGSMAKGECFLPLLRPPGLVPDVHNTQLTTVCESSSRRSDSASTGAALVHTPSIQKWIIKQIFKRDANRDWMKPKPERCEIRGSRWRTSKGQAIDRTPTLNVPTSTQGMSASWVFLRWSAWYWWLHLNLHFGRCWGKLNNYACWFVW